MKGSLRLFFYQNVIVIVLCNSARSVAPVGGQVWRDRKAGRDAICLEASEDEFCHLPLDAVFADVWNSSHNQDWHI